MASINTNPIKSESDVKTYLAGLKYALDHGSKVSFKKERRVDEKRNPKFTNKHTMATLFPDENPVEVLKRELPLLSSENYLRTIEDIKFPDRPEWWEFGKVYNETDEVYIKIRVCLLDGSGAGTHTTFVMSFHFAERPFSEEIFPYKK